MTAVECDKVTGLLDYEIILRLNAINRALGGGRIAVARGWAIQLRRLVDQLIEELEKEMEERGCLGDSCPDHDCLVYYCMGRPEVDV
ncbi:hypothetical protein [Geoglobus acetivorans]|uniref:Uncharacterized protein n=1 Tax=Geoglobus acetivorans TaxID=565033 RepID=A0A0A7GDL8_GEOAI|nr:hypothetical protein GACE_0876 [Geoglobus acetivorans]